METQYDNTSREKIGMEKRKHETKDGTSPQDGCPWDQNGVNMQ